MLQRRIAEWEADHRPRLRYEPSLHPLLPNGGPDWSLEHTRLGYIAYHADETFPFSYLMGDEMVTLDKSLVTRLDVAPYPSERLPDVRVVSLAGGSPAKRAPHTCTARPTSFIGSSP